MIRYLKRKDINDVKYNKCIEKAINTRIYAYSWYLDIVADHWNALVIDDYKIVMPLPWRSKYFIKYIYTPCWTQQLGVFSSTKVKSEILSQLLNNIPKNYRKVTINYNSDNNFENEKLTEMVNYILPLDKPYKELFQKYQYIRRRAIKQLSLSEITIAEGENHEEIIQLFIEQKQKEVDLRTEDYECLNRITSMLKFQGKALIISAYNKQDEFIGGAIFFIGLKRISYMFSAITQEGRDKQIMTSIIDSVIEKYSNTNYIFDFEGSMIPGIAFFFKSFGAKKEIYFTYQKYLSS
ncbi:hypothetical protein [Urechidicola croceus]|uniref:BioF2-like acetyltransferase domain-containing protein n=1 Tax=Urechidicola croceus TaxID=1850246 RepID=A0A1D8PB33_9FLAO|nr:hypothetical protein [Urechidicola croceus]AOW21775.1 hypothetical protein LPB138_14290 [Urechidicola croceus]